MRSERWVREYLELYKRYKADEELQADWEKLEKIYKIVLAREKIKKYVSDREKGRGIAQGNS